MATKQERNRIKNLNRLRDEQAEKLVKELIALIKQASNQASSIALSDAEKADKLQRIQDIYDAMDNEALGLIRQRIAREYRDELNSIRESLEARGYESAVVGASRDTLVTLLDYDTKKVSTLLTSYVDDVKGSLVREIISGNGFNIEELVNPITKRIEPVVITEVQTLASGFSRAVLQETANELDLDYFEYIGPDDNITREFCQDVLDGTAPGLPNRSVPIYTRAELEALDSADANGQGLPVSIYGGGFNCRHEWLAMDLEEARANGYEGA